MESQDRVILDRASLALLYQQVAPKMLDAIYKRISSFQDAEDILTDTFVAALESTRFASLTETEQCAWLWRVARNKVIDRYRRQRGTQSPLPIDIAEPLMESVRSNPEEISIQQEEEGDLTRLMKQLSPMQQQVLYLRFGENLRCAHIAARVGKRESSIRSLISRTLKLLRFHYNEQEKGAHLDGTLR